MSTQKPLKPAIEVFHFPKFTKASEVLKAAKRVIQDERRWVMGDLAMTQRLEKLIPEELQAGQKPGLEWVACSAKVPKSGKCEAMAFCALGAVIFVNGPAQKQATKFLSIAAAIDLENAYLDAASGKLLFSDGETTESGSPRVYNPSTDDVFELNDAIESHSRVMGMFALAIKLAKKAEAKLARK